MLLDVRKERESARKELRALNTVPDDPDRIVRLLSGGNQQKVVLARWLLHGCRVLLLDEPTRGVDIATKAEIYRIIGKLAQSGLGVLVVSSELEELAHICTRVLVMRDGEIVAEVDGKDATERELLRHAVAPNGCSRSRRGGCMTAPAQPSGPGRGAALTQRVKTLELQEYALAIVVVLLFVAGAILKPDTFPTWDNVRNMLTQASVVGVLAIGMTFVIATAGIDLSVGSMVAAAGVFGGIMVGTDGTSSLVFILAAIAFATFLGTVNATAVAYGRVVPFIATLAMFSVARGLALLLNDQLPVSLLDLNGGSFGDPRPFSLLWFGNGRIGGIPVSVYVFLGITVIGWIVLNRTRYGRYVVAVGGNREAARIAGVPVRRIIFSVYALSGFLAGISAVLLCARLGSASPVSGNLYELDAIGAVVIGGTALAGGRATIVGTFLGVLTFALIFSLMTQLNLSTEIQQVTKGLIVLGAVLLQRPEARY